MKRIALPKLNRMLAVSMAITLAVLTSFMATPPPAFIKLKDGIVVYPNPQLSGHTKAVKLQVIADNIIRVTAAAEKNFPASKSLIIIGSPNPNTRWDVVTGKEQVILKTKMVMATVVLKTGAVSFADSKGHT